MTRVVSLKLDEIRGPWGGARHDDKESHDCPTTDARLVDGWEGERHSLPRSST
jgi:hypothetical protein